MDRPIQCEKKPKRLAHWLVLAAMSGCSSDPAEQAPVGAGKPRGSPCAAASECKSGVCSNGVCVGNGLGAPAGSACSAGDQCASSLCVNGACAAGRDLPAGASCAHATECAAGECTDGVCASTGPIAGGTGGEGGEPKIGRASCRERGQ